MEARASRAINTDDVTLCMQVVLGIVERASVDDALINAVRVEMPNYGHLPNLGRPMCIVESIHRSRTYFVRQ